MIDEENADVAKMLDFFKVEPLHPALQSHYHERPGGGPMIVHHKYVISVMHHESLNRWINQLYLARRDAVDEAARTANWHRYVFLHERPYRFDALRNVLLRGKGLTDAQHWQLVGSVWQDCENVHENFTGWRKIWSSNRPGRENAMDEKDRDALAKMPSLFSVWRGYSHPAGRRGLSWTFDPERARWFARRFAETGDRPRVVNGSVHRSRVLAYFSSRNESEVVVLPVDVQLPCGR